MHDKFLTKYLFLQLKRNDALKKPNKLLQLMALLLKAMVAQL